MLMRLIEVSGQLEAEVYLIILFHSSNPNMVGRPFQFRLLKIVEFVDFKLNVTDDLRASVSP